MAVLSTKLDALTSLVRDYCERQQQDHDAIGVVRTDLAGKARG